MSEPKNVHPLIAKRFSPAVFSSKPVDETTLRSLFEATQWAASCFNEQPWRFIVATADQPEAFAKVLSTLGEANQLWAKNAPVLMISLAKMTFSRNDEPNRHAWHDVGLAVGNLSMEAASRDLFLHQMAGFSPEKAQEVLEIPEDYAPVAAVALGYLGDPSQAPEAVRKKHEKTETM